MDVTRYDAVPLRAVVDPVTGYLRDSPIVGRSGVQEYRQANGRVVREYRSPDVVFAADALAGLHGIPIIDEHQGMVTAANVRKHAIGTVLSQGRQDGKALVTDVVIYDTTPITKSGRKELSLAYSVRLDETPGITPEGEAYDTRVMSIVRYDHLAIVAKGRAGIARLRLDGADAASTDISDTEDASTMPDPVVMVRLDGGLSYSAAPEVAHALDAARAALAASASRADAADAERDAQRARADAAEAAVAAARTDADARLAAAVADAAAAARVRVGLEAVATQHGATFKQDAADRDVRLAVIAKLEPSADMTGKSDAYVDVYFDRAIAGAKTRADSGAEQIKTVFTSPSAPKVPLSAQAAREQMIRQARG